MSCLPSWICSTALPIQCAEVAHAELMGVVNAVNFKRRRGRRNAGCHHVRPIRANRLSGRAAALCQRRTPGKRGNRRRNLQSGQRAGYSGKLPRKASICNCLLHRKECIADDASLIKRKTLRSMRPVVSSFTLPQTWLRMPESFSPERK